ncbi:MAG: sensor histidine kinase [Clostridia bacterium]|nr:sensor histidine kinase [Clostridia bacterium]
MRELSLNVLDIAQNSISAGASVVEITVQENSGLSLMTIIIKDNGCGMDEKSVKNVMDPFYTTRTTRKVGMGVPLFKMAAEMTGGSLEIESAVGKGTQVKTVFHTDHVDFTPLGDIDSTIVTLITLNTSINFIYTLKVDGNEFRLSTQQLKDILGGVPLDMPEVVMWLKDYIKEQTQIIRGGVTQ